MGALVALSAVGSGFFTRFGRREKSSATPKGTMFDVRHLLMQGRKDLAIQLYCEIFNTIPAKAKKDVEELERSLKV